MSLTLNGDEECEDEERGEDGGGEGFVRESHLVNSNICRGQYKTKLYKNIIIRHLNDMDVFQNLNFFERNNQ